MRAVVGVTDNAWAEFLRLRPYLSEANFWLPTEGTSFRALGRGEPFLFKTHWPDNRLVGGGFFSGYAALTIVEAWEIHGESNGAADLPALVASIARYRQSTPDLSSRIGCILLRDIFFAAPAAAIPAPVDFAKNIVRYKGYDVDPGSPIEANFAELLSVSSLRLPELTGSQSIPGPTRGLPRLAVPRVGQDAFKSLILTSYRRRCAVTGNRVQPVLQAAHIRPVADQGEHRVDNGLLLRSDVHILFDRGYLGIDEQHRLRVSPALRADFGNGDEFYARQGHTIGLPERRSDRPSREAVVWHMDTRFRG